MAPFRLAANIGLILFLFLVGLEINLAYLLSNWRVAASVATLDMAVPFGLGVAVAYGLYNELLVNQARRRSRSVYSHFSSVSPWLLRRFRSCVAS